MYHAREIAFYIIERYGNKMRDLTNLKLQKLLYLIQGEYLKQTDEFLMYEDFWAWKFGPVVPGVYRYFSHFVASPIYLTDEEKNMVCNILDASNESLIIDRVMDFYGKKTAAELVRITHDQLPWKQTNENKGVDNIIPKYLLKEYFSPSNA